MIAIGALVVLAAYLLGAIPTGYLLFKWGSRGDIRRVGSGNIGATNVFRSSGRWMGIATLAMDIGKGALAVAVVLAGTGDPAWAAAAAFAAVLGHCYPVFLRFRGGKGIATGCGAYAVLAPVPMGITLVVFVAAMLTTRMVSVGSIAAGLALPALILWLQPDRFLLGSVGGAVLLAIVRHRTNIERIVRGGEHRIDGA